MSTYTVVSYRKDLGRSDFTPRKVSSASDRRFRVCRCFSGLSLRSVFSKSELKIKILVYGTLLREKPFGKIVGNGQIGEGNFKQVSIGLYARTRLCLFD